MICSHKWVLFHWFCDLWLGLLLMKLLVVLPSLDVHWLLDISNFWHKTSKYDLGWSFLLWEKFAENLGFPNQSCKNLQPVGRFWKFHTNLSLPNQLGKNYQPVGFFWKIVLVSVLVRPVGQKHPTGWEMLKCCIFILRSFHDHWTSCSSLRYFFSSFALSCEVVGETRGGG